MAALPAIAIVASLAAGGLQAMGSIRQGQAQKAAMNYQAKEQERTAAAEVASAQREAIGKREEGERLMSRQLAVAGASGAGIVNPSMLDIFSETAEDADINAQMSLYGGQDRATGLRAGAAASRFKGKAAMQGAMYDAAGSILSGIGKAAGGGTGKAYG